MQTEAQEQIYLYSSQTYNEAAKYIRGEKDHCFGNVYLRVVGKDFMTEIVTTEGDDGRHSGMGAVQEFT